MDPLLEIIAAPPKITAKTEDLLEENASQFLRAGGVLRLSDWAKLTPASRAAFLKANQEIEATRILRNGMATSPAGAALAIKDLDGGQAAAEVAVKLASIKAKIKVEKGGRK